MTVLTGAYRHTYMVAADLHAPVPVDAMAAGDLGIEAPKAPAEQRSHGLVTPDGQHIDPAKLAAAVRAAGIADAERGRYLPQSFPGSMADYTAGHAEGTLRQRKIWPPPNHSGPRLPSVVDAWVQRVRERLRRV